MRLGTTWLTCVMLALAVGCGGGDKDKDKDNGGNAGGGDGGHNAHHPADGNDTPKPGGDDTDPKPGGNVADLGEELRFLNENHFAAAVVHPKRAWGSDLLQALPAGLKFDQIEQNLGFDVRTADRVVVLWHGPNDKQLEEMRADLADNDGGNEAIGKKPAVEEFKDDEDRFEGKTPEEIDAILEKEEAEFEAERAAEEAKWEARMKERETAPGGAGDVSYVIWLDTAVDREAFVASHEKWDPIEEIKVGEHTAHRVETREAILFLDDKTVMVGAPPVLEEMLAAKSASGPLAAAFANVTGEYDALFIADQTNFAEARKLMRQMFNQRGVDELPPKFKGAPDAVESIRTLTARLDVSEEGTLATVRLTGMADGDAAAIEKEVKNALEYGKAMYTVLTLSAGQLPPEGQEGMGLLTSAINGVKTTTEGNTVVVTVPHPEGTVDFVKKSGPAILAAQEAAKLTVFRNNLKQVGLAFHNYHDTFTHFPAAVAYKDGDTPLLSWRVEVLPFLEEYGLYEEILDLGIKAWDSEDYADIARDMPAIFASPGVIEPGMTTLMVFTGPNTPFKGLGRPVAEGEKKISGPRIRDFVDGTSNTILAVYAAPEKAVPWMKPVDLTIDPEDPLASVGQIPETGLHVLMCDGSVRTLPKDIAAETLKNLVNNADGNVVEIP